MNTCIRLFFKRLRPQLKCHLTFPKYLTAILPGTREKVGIHHLCLKVLGAALVERSSCSSLDFYLLPIISQICCTISSLLSLTMLFPQPWLLFLPMETQREAFPECSGRINYFYLGHILFNLHILTLLKFLHLKTP